MSDDQTKRTDDDSSESEAGANGETSEFAFKAEVQQVLSLVVNSLYTNPEIFLRELISNASDALDKARLVQLTQDEAAEQQGQPTIDIRLDADAKSLTIEDNGVGMTRDEVVENLGTIARSGTSEFLAKHAELSKEGDQERALELIGQFGVGFYSAFMVAQRVDVETRSMMPDSEAVLWRSSGTGSFSVAEGEREQPGTRVVVHLKDDFAEFARSWRVSEVIKKYSDFVMFPIRVDEEVVNQSSALWRLPRSQVTVEQHAEFFKHLTGGQLGDEPLQTVHYAVDAPVQFSALLYVPKKASADLFFQQKQRPGLRLYARRVLIMENCESLTPSYLRFVRGVVDSEDVSLNVSREMLQEDQTVARIEQQLTKQLLKSFKELAEEDADRYDEFWKELGPVFKEGLATDWANKDAIAELCRFESLNTEAGKVISLRDYLAAKSDDQREIYYLTGASRQQVERSPHLEAFRKRGWDVLLLSDPIDEWVVKSLPEYEKVRLTSVAHGELDLGDDDQEEEGDSPADKDQIEATAQAIGKVLGERIDEVRVSTRLTETASCLVSKEGDPSAHFERLMKMVDDGAAGAHKRVLEINPRHAFIQNMATVVERDPESSHIEPWAEMLYDQAQLSEGVVEDPAKLVGRLQELLVQASSAVVGKTPKD